MGVCGGTTVAVALLEKVKGSKGHLGIALVVSRGSSDLAAFNALDAFIPKYFGAEHLSFILFLMKALTIATTSGLVSDCRILLSAQHLERQAQPQSRPFRD